MDDPHIMDNEKRALLKSLPSVDLVLQTEELEEIGEDFPRWYVLDFVRDILAEKREEIIAGPEEGAEQNEGLSAEAVALEAIARMRDSHKFSLKRVINATGIVLHTNLGRAVLGREALDNVMAVGGSYSNLEFDLESGGRGSRHSHLQALLRRLTGAEGAMVVNNNAAALMLALDTMAQGKEVVISRGELIEIGGSFRIPDIMRKSGAQLREVGTTNRTHLRDYAAAITDNTGLLLKVHTSNYKIVGFTAEVALEELVELGAQYDMPVMEDLGSGNFVSSVEGVVIPEPTVEEKVKTGADIISFSGDKLLGGPQAGIIVGKEDCIKRLAANPLARALRVDKFTVAALEATLQIFLEGGEALRRIPTLGMLSAPIEELGAKARALIDMVGNQTGEDLVLSISEDVSQAGGGSLPEAGFPTMVVALTSRTLNPEQMEERMRTWRVPILGRISRDRYLLDMRTVGEDQLQEIAAALKQLME